MHQDGTRNESPNNQMERESGPNRAVLDGNVLIAVIRPDAGHVPPEEAQACIALVDAVDRGSVQAYLCAPILAEIVHVLARNGIPPRMRTELMERWEAMHGRLEIIPLDGALAAEAGEYRQQHYHREHLPLSYIDCFCVALARRLGAPVVTLDEPLLRAPGVVAIPPSRFFVP